MATDFKLLCQELCQIPISCYCTEWSLLNRLKKQNIHSCLHLSPQKCYPNLNKILISLTGLKINAVLFQVNILFWWVRSWHYYHYHVYLIFVTQWLLNAAQRALGHCSQTHRCSGQFTFLRKMHPSPTSAKCYMNHFNIRSSCSAWHIISL